MNRRDFVFYIAYIPQHKMLGDDNMYIKPLQVIMVCTFVPVLLRTQYPILANRAFFKVAPFF